MDDRSTFLSHVLWLGGPPDAGKTAVASVLAEWHGLQLYHLDDQEAAHHARADKAHKPTLWASKPENLSPEQRWLTWLPDETAYNTIDAWTEAFEYACEDLLDMPKSPPIIAEGAGLFPDLVMLVTDDPQQAAWLIPSETFKTGSARGKGKPAGREQTTDPQQATENLIARDFFLTGHIRDRAEALGLTIIEVDGSRTVEDIAMQLEEQWGRWLH